MPTSFLPRRSPRWYHPAAITALVFLAVLGPASAAEGQVAGGGRSTVSLFVTSPPDPIPAAPGTPASASLTVGNLGQSPVDVTISTRAVQLLDGGKTRFLAGPDPRFANRVTVTPSALSLPARSEQTVRVAVDMPVGLPPDDYFLGLLVSPVINSPSVTVENDIGGLVVLAVPGARNRSLTAQFQGPSWLSLSFSSSASGVVRAKSVGTSTVAFTTTEINSGWPSPDPRFVELNPQLLPPGLTRDVPVHVSSWLGLGWYTIHATLVYDRSDQRTDEVALSRTVLIVNPLWGLLLLVIVVLLAWRHRRRRGGRRKGQHSAGRSKPQRPRGRTEVERRGSREERVLVGR